MSKKMGRPEVVFDWELLDHLCQHKLILSDISDIMKVSEDTIARRIKSETDLTFAEYKEKKLGATRLKLVERALSMAMNGSVPMMIFCLKNMAGWADKVETINEDKDKNKKTITLQYSLPEKVTRKDKEVINGEK